MGARRHRHQTLACASLNSNSGSVRFRISNTQRSCGARVRRTAPGAATAMVCAAGAAPRRRCPKATGAVMLYCIGLDCGVVYKHDGANRRRRRTEPSPASPILAYYVKIIIIIIMIMTLILILIMIIIMIITIIIIMIIKITKKPHARVDSLRIRSPRRTPFHCHHRHHHIVNIIVAVKTAIILQDTYNII